MAFEGLSDKLQGIFGGLKNRGSLSEADIDNAMHQVMLLFVCLHISSKFG